MAHPVAPTLVLAATAVAVRKPRLLTRTAETTARPHAAKTRARERAERRSESTRLSYTRQRQRLLVVRKDLKPQKDKRSAEGDLGRDDTHQPVAPPAAYP